MKKKEKKRKVIQFIVTIESETSVFMCTAVHGCVTFSAFMLI